MAKKNFLDNPALRFIDIPQENDGGQAEHESVNAAQNVGSIESKLDELISIVESKPEPAVADKGDEPGAVALVELKIALSSADYKRATAYLRKRSDDISVAFMEVINGRT